MRRFGRIAVRLFAAFLVFGVAMVIVGAVYVWSVDLPPDQVPVQTSFIYDRHHTLIAELSNGENRQSVSLSQVPPILVEAVIAAEDRRFYEHSGVDPIGIVRAVAQDLRQPNRRQGGSTITQQYVKNVYVGRELTLRRKLREAAIAVKLERRLSKDQILERYLNTIYFGRGAYGVQLAAQAYFGKNVEQIDLAEAAYLAALIRGPESTDASRNEEKARRRRSSVLSAMVDTGSISAAQAADAELRPLTGPDGVVERTRRTSYSRPEAGAEFFVDLVKRDLIARFGEAVVTAGGLKVTTTLDLDLQARARKAVFAKMLPKIDDPDAAVVTLNHAGEVLVLVGGRDFNRSQVNLAVGSGGGGRGRAAGSAFKPFVAAAMLRAGYSMESAFKAPASITIDGADVGGAPWNVANYEDRSYPTLNVNDAMRQSVNTVFAQIVTNAGMGSRRVVDEARMLGITSPLNPVDSIALGTQNVGPLEMADAYLTFANRGMRRDPSVLRAVTGSDGNSLKVRPAEPQRVMKARDADVINRMLVNVVTGGTGVAARAKGMTVAGKTGTTNDYNDAWFVGYTPGSDSPEECCVMAIWMGYANGDRQMANVEGRSVTGGSYPAELFSRILVAARDGAPTGSFAPVPRYRGELLGGSRRRIQLDAGPADAVADTSLVDPLSAADPVVAPTTAGATPIEPTLPPVSVSVSVVDGSEPMPVEAPTNGVPDAVATPEPTAATIPPPAKVPRVAVTNPTVTGLG